MPQWRRTSWGVVWHRVAETDCRNENVTTAELDDFLFQQKDNRKWLWSQQKKARKPDPTQAWIVCKYYHKVHNRKGKTNKHISYIGCSAVNNRKKKIIIITNATSSKGKLLCFCLPNANFHEQQKRMTKKSLFHFIKLIKDLSTIVQKCIFKIGNGSQFHPCLSLNNHICLEIRDMYIHMLRGVDIALRRIIVQNKWA